MAGLDATELVVGANGNVYVAPTGTAFPTDIATALNAAFIDLGYVSEDGAKFTDAKTMENVPAWQSFYPLRRLITGRDATVTFTLLQWNEDVVRLAFGGGTLTATATGWKYDPPAPETLDERAFVLKWSDGTKNYLVGMPRAIVSENVEVDILRTNAAMLPITLGVVGSAATSPWFMLTNDPNWNVIS